MKPIGIYGGTFDPVHYGHIWPVLEVRDRTGITEIRYIPNFHPPHRSAPRTDAAHRLNMLRMALSSYPGMQADDREIVQAGRSRTVSTLRSLRGEFPLRPLCLLIGMDAFLEFEKWHSWQHVLRLANVIVMTRPGFSRPRRLPSWWRCADTDDSAALSRTVAGLVYQAAVQPVRISATEVRRKLACGSDISAEVPQTVIDYLTNNNLYK